MTAFTLCTVCFTVCVLFNEYRYTQQINSEMRFLEAYDRFLSRVRHFYYYRNSINDAVYMAVEGCEKYIRPRMKQLLKMLENGDEQSAGGDMTGACSDKAGTKYGRGHDSNYVPGMYERMLLSLARAVNENGDSCNNGRSVFVDSVMQLRNDVQDRRRLLGERKHRFTGLGLTASLPVLAVPFIAQWACDILPSLQSFYYGRTGVVVRLGLLVLTVVCYLLVARLRSGGDQIADLPIFVRRIQAIDKPKKQLYAMLATVLVMICCLCGGHANKRELLLEDVSDIDSLCETADSRQLAAMERLIPMYVEKLTETGGVLPEGIVARTDAGGVLSEGSGTRIDAGGVLSEGSETRIDAGTSGVTVSDEGKETDTGTMELILQIKDALLNEQGIRTDAVAEAAAEEIVRRYTQYGREKYDLWDVLITLCCAVLAYFTPMLSEKFAGAFTVNRQQDEILIFQSLIHMQKNVPGMSPVTMLESMEQYSVCFKGSITRCLNDYNIDERAALTALAEAEPNPGFTGIIDCFMAVDEAGVESAFDEISDEIINFRENRKLAGSILLDNDALLASLLAVIPGGVILFGYLLIPFMLRSLSMFDTYQDVLSDYAVSV